MRKPHSAGRHYRNGEYFKYYDSGVLKEYCSNYTDNKPHGILASFDKEGNLLKETKYSKGVRHGPDKTYHHMYSFAVEEIYDNGTLIETKKYNY